MQVDLIDQHHAGRREHVFAKHGVEERHAVGDVCNHAQHGTIAVAEPAQGKTLVRSGLIDILDLQIIGIEAVGDMHLRAVRNRLKALLDSAPHRSELRALLADAQALRALNVLRRHLEEPRKELVLVDHRSQRVSISIEPGECLAALGTMCCGTPKTTRTVICHERKH